MQLNAYPKYKDSDIQWIGKIPEEWDINKVKHNVNSLGKTGLEASEGNEEGKYPFFTSSQIQNKFIEKAVFNSECLILSTGGCASIHYFNGGFSASNDCMVLKKQKNISLIFLCYQILDNLQVIDDLGFWGMGLRHLQKYFFYNLFVCWPRKEEQIKIADFLDKKTAEADDLIEKDKKLIELLKEKRTALINHTVTKGLDPNAKMKDSGIPWIGKIPENWEAKKLKQISEINISNVDKKSDEDEPEVLLCNYIDVYKNEFIDSTINFMKATASVEQIRRFTIKMGDVIITKDSEEPTDIAIPALIIEDLKNVVCGYHLALIRSNKMILDGSFLFRALQSKQINDQFITEANGVTRFGISTYPILNSYILIPPLSEQIQIAEYLDKTTLKIDRTIEKTEAKLELLEEFKKSLIHHAVTGKIDIREVKI